MTASNLNIVLTNALCCISAQSAKVSKLLSIGDKCVESEIQKLKLMNDWFNVLKCHNLNSSINAKFGLRIPYITYTTVSSVNILYVITVNGIEYSAPGDGITLVVNLVGNLLVSATGVIALNIIINPDGYNPRYAYIDIETDCTVEVINYKRIRIADGVILTDGNYTMYQTGLCTITNCLTEDQFNTIVANLMHVCNICECQLNKDNVVNTNPEEITPPITEP